MTKSFLFALAISFVSTTFAQGDPSKKSTTYKFDEILTYINRMYVDPVDDVALADAAIIAMLEKLDPHSTYISKEDVEDANQSINGSFVGVGIRFQILKDTLMVVQTIPGGPSEKLGILAGDKIVKIGDDNVAGVGFKNSMVRERLLGDKGTKVKVEILRKNGEKPLVFTITRDKIPVYSVDAAYMVTPAIGYIKLNSFSRTTIEEVESAIKTLKKEGMKDLILDLQNNGGGLLTAAQKLADEFLTGDKLVVYSEGRARPRTDLKAGDTKEFEKGRLVILTNEYSASASEIVSGAIQDWDRGLIVGRRTYGKGLVQQPIDLSDGSQIRLTIARYYTPTGRFIQKPYDDVDAYKKDLLHRYENGEFYHVDSIHLPDSLKFNTLIMGRTVFGGGGIMPDIFVPIDTSEVTDSYRSLIRSGTLNSFSLTYVDQNRASITQKHPTFKDFKKDFVIDDEYMNQYLEYTRAENSEIELKEDEMKLSDKLLKVRLKAVLAQNLYGISEFYEINNEDNEALIRALKALNSNEYSKAGLAEKK